MMKLIDFFESMSFSHFRGRKRLNEGRGGYFSGWFTIGKWS